MGVISGGLVCVAALSISTMALKEQQATKTPPTEEVTKKKNNSKPKSSNSALTKKEKKKVDAIIKEDKKELGNYTSQLLGDGYKQSVSEIRETPVEQIVAAG